MCSRVFGLIRFFTHDNGVAFTFEFTQEDLDRAPKEIETYYAPSYVPDRFHLADQSCTTIALDYLYFNDSGETYYYSQSVLWEYEIDPDNPDAILIGHTVNSENVILEDRVLQGYEVRIVHMPHPDLGDVEDTVAFWTDHQYFFELGGPNLNAEEINRIIASMTVISPP